MTAPSKYQQNQCVERRKGVHVWAAQERSLQMIHPHLEERNRVPYFSQPKLSDTLLGDGPLTFSSLAALPSNIQAIEAGMQFAHNLRPYVAVLGPSGWGKSHLLESVAAIMQYEGHSRPVLTSALDWLNSQARIDCPEPLLLDDVQDVDRRPRARHQLRTAVERRVLLRRPTFLSFNYDRPNRLTKDLMCVPRMWTVTTIHEPTVDERELIVCRVAASARISIHRSIARVIANHLHGNGRSILGALKRLHLAKQDWSREEDLSQACGILMPYLLGRDGWDIRDVAYEAISSVVSSEETKRAIFCWILRSEVGLSEEEISAFLRVAPSRVYKYADSVNVQRAADPMKTLLDQSRSAVRRRLQND